MKSKKFQNGCKAIRWTRFSRAAYATFNSLHKVINVGVLSLAIIASVDAKAKTQHGEKQGEMLQNYTLEDVEVLADSSTTTLNEEGQHIAVISTCDIQSAPERTVNDLLKQLPNIDVRQRGGFGVQTDISIRGASADQTTLLLNGVNISSPQTGHLSADFPVSSDAISKIELTEGGTGAAGTLNISVEPDSVNRLDVQAITGFYGLLEGNVLMNLNAKQTSHKINASASRSDGAVDNGDFKQVRFYYLGRTETNKILCEWQGGYSRQSFGANTFYSAAYPDQWEGTNRILTSARLETKTPVKFNGLFSWVRSYDHFQLVRDTSFGENFHRTDVFNFKPEISHRWVGGKTSLKVDYKYENIYSSNLGIPMENDSVKILGHDGKYYKRHKDRHILAATLQHNLLFRKWNLNFGVSAVKNFDDEDKVRFLPFINTKIEINKHWMLFASWNNALRVPTFTELFYKSPTNEGNTNLKSELTSTVSLSAQYKQEGLLTNVTTFFTRGEKMIDWVMQHDTDKVYKSANYDLNNMGAEIDGTLIFNELCNCIPMRLSLGYHFIHQDRKDDTPVFKSYYALEYLKHKFTARFTIEIIKNLEAQLSYHFQVRNGGYLVYEDHKSTNVVNEYDPYGVMDFKISYTLKKFSVFGELNNVLNTHYYDFGNVEQPGIVGKLGVKYRFLQ